MNTAAEPPCFAQCDTELATLYQGVQKIPQPDYNRVCTADTGSLAVAAKCLKIACIPNGGEQASKYIEYTIGLYADKCANYQGYLDFSKGAASSLSYSSAALIFSTIFAVLINKFLN
jgi:hypothetical protein